MSEKKKIHPLAFVAAGLGLYLLSQGDKIGESAKLEMAAKEAKSEQVLVNNAMSIRDKAARDGSINALTTRVDAGAIPVQSVVANQYPVGLDGNPVRVGLYVVDNFCSTAVVNSAGRMDELLKVQLDDITACKRTYARSALAYFGITVLVPEPNTFGQ